MDHPVRDEMRELYRRVPLLQRLSRGVVYALRETMALGITRDRRWLKALKLNARLHLRRQVRDPELRARLTPDYEIFCKRIVLSSKWYPAIQAPNVDLVTSGVRELRERSIVDGDGPAREIDTLILATGFTPSARPSRASPTSSWPPTTKRSRSGLPPPSGTRVAAGAGTSTAPAATRSSGPASRSSTGAAHAASTPRPTGSRRPPERLLR
jgi:cation diffusion facilitator CzcD-associated flavoprotein CzcO